MVKPLRLLQSAPVIHDVWTTAQYENHLITVRFPKLYAQDALTQETASSQTQLTVRYYRVILDLSVRNGETRADCQCGALIYCIAAGAPIRKFLFIKALGHTQVPFARVPAGSRAGVELAANRGASRVGAAADLGNT
jgi:hypothetical protein